MAFTKGLLVAVVSLPWLTQALIHPIMAGEFRAGHDNIHPRQEPPLASSSTTTSVTVTQWVNGIYSPTILPSHSSTLPPTSTLSDAGAIAPTQPGSAIPVTFTSNSTHWSFTRSWGSSSSTAISLLAPGPAAPSLSSTSQGALLSFTRPWDLNNAATTASPISGPVTPSVSISSTSSTSIPWSFTRPWGSSTSIISAPATESTSLPGTSGPVAPSISSTGTEDVPPTPTITSTRTQEVTLTPGPSSTTSLSSTGQPASPTPWNPKIPDLLHEPQLSTESVCGRWYTRDYSYWIVQMPPQWWKKRYQDSSTDACYRFQLSLWAILGDFLECFEMTHQQASAAPGWLHMRFETAQTDPENYAVEGIINEIRDPSTWRRNPIPNRCRNFPVEKGDMGLYPWQMRDYDGKWTDGKWTGAKGEA